MNIILLIIVGIIVGYIGGYAGIGGAPFLILFLTLVLGVEQHAAQGTVLAMMLGPMTFMGLYAYKAKIKENLKPAMIMCASYAFFSYFGASFAFVMDASTLKIAFSILLLLTAFNELFKFTAKINDNLITLPMNAFTLIGSGAIVGIAGGIFGIGAGILMMPIFLNIFDLDQIKARVLSLLILFPPVSLGAVIKYHNEGAIIYSYVFILFISYFVTNYFGAKKAKDASVSNFKKIYSYILILIAIINIIYVVL